MREVAGATNLSYLLPMVWARWLGLTRRDRRVVQALWVVMAAFFILLFIASDRSELDIQDTVAFLALTPLSVGLSTIALIFRMGM